MWIAQSGENFRENKKGNDECWPGKQRLKWTKNTRQRIFPPPLVVYTTKMLTNFCNNMNVLLPQKQKMKEKTSFFNKNVSGSANATIFFSDSARSTQEILLFLS